MKLKKSWRINLITLTALSIVTASFITVSCRHYNEDFINLIPSDDNDKTKFESRPADTDPILLDLNNVSVIYAYKGSTKITNFDFKKVLFSGYDTKKYDIVTTNYTVDVINNKVLIYFKLVNKHTKEESKVQLEEIVKFNQDLLGELEKIAINQAKKTVFYYPEKENVYVNDIDIDKLSAFGYDRNIVEDIEIIRAEPKPSNKDLLEITFKVHLYEGNASNPLYFFYLKDFKKD